MSLEKLERLIGVVPNPAVDRDALLALRDPANVLARDLAARLHTNAEWSSAPLRDLLPGLSLIAAPNFLIRLSLRAANPLLRVDVGSLKALAPRTPDDILLVPRIGTGTGEEILAVVLSEWAMAYLDEGPARVEPRSSGEDAPKVKSEPRELAKALAGIEGVVAFEAYRRRQLDPGVSPTQSEVAADLGIPPERVAHYEKTIRGMLEKQMRKKQSALSSAAAYLQERLGPLARPQELDGALVELDPADRALPDDMPHRRTLLLSLAGLRSSAQWVVDVEIEGIVDALLRGLTESGPVDLDVIDRQLARLGVRKELRLPWIVIQSGFQVANGRLARIDGE